jgi:hypothetical protein
MKYDTVEDVVTSFPRPILPTLQGDPDYQTIHAIRKLLQANARVIDTQLGGGALVHLGLIFLEADYAMVAQTTTAGPTIWVNPIAPGRAPENVDSGIAAQLSTARHVWEEAVRTFRTFNTVQQALKKHFITVFEPMYFDILNDNMVGFANISAHEMLDHLFMTYGNITALDLEHNFEQMRQAWDRQQPVESLFKQIRGCADFSEAGGVITGHPQQINVGYAKIFSTGQIMSACRRWNEKQTIEKLGHNSRHTSLLYTASTSKCRGGPQQPQGIMQQTPLWVKQRTKWLINIGALANLETSTATDRGVVATLTEVNARLAKQLEDNASELLELKALLKKERTESRFQRTFNPSTSNYFCTHCYKVGNTHTGLSCNFPKQGHNREDMLIPQVRLAHKYPISPWEMIHPPGGHNPIRI